MSQDLPGEWIPYQPKRERDKEYYDIKLRDGTVVPCCYPNGTHWTFMHPVFRPPRAYNGPVADYRVVAIRRCQSPVDIRHERSSRDSAARESEAERLSARFKDHPVMAIVGALGAPHLSVGTCGIGTSTLVRSLIMASERLECIALEPPQPKVDLVSLIKPKHIDIPKV